MAYTLKITEDPGLYTAQIDDRYELTGGSKRSVGKVAGGGTVDVLTLEPDESSKTFTATVSGTRLTALNGWITWTDTTEVRGPGSMAVPPSADPSPSVPNYTITFDSNEGSEVAAITAKQGTQVNKPEDPIKDEVYFFGWFDAEGGENEYDWPHTLNADVTMHAHWTKDPYFTISFNDHNDSVADIKKKKGETVDEMPIPTWDEYHTFDGWFSADGETKYDDGFWPHTLKGNIAMHAHWTVQQFTITFNTHGDTTVPPITQDGGTTVNEPGEPTKSNHRFLGWFPVADSGAKYTWSHTLTESLTMHAQWIRQYTITFETHGGSAVTAITQDVDTTVTKPTDPTWGVSQFNGWFNAASGGTEYNVWPHTLTGDVTMHAQWKHPVTFHPLGGSPAPEPVSVPAGETVSAPESMTKAAGGMYTGAIADVADLTVTFVDWYDNPAYSNSPYNFSTAVTAPLDLYAKWSQPVVDIYSQSGAHTLAQALNYIKGLATLSEPTPFTIVLDGSSETYTMAGVNYSSSNINKTNAVITLVGKKATTISLSSDGYLFNISAGELVLGKNITLKGITSNSCALVIVRDSTSTLTMKAGAAITDNARSEGNGTGGGVSVYNSGSTFNMEDGTISGNSADRGGGVSVYSGTFKMSGGTISGNSAKLYGGGVYVYDNGGSFNKTEGFIGGDNDNTPHPGNGNATDNTVKDNASGQGHAVYYLKSPGYYRDKTLESGDNISTNTVPLSGIDYNWTKK